MLELSTRRNKYGVPIASAEMLNRFATGILYDYNPSLLEYPQAIEILALAEDYFRTNVYIHPLTANGSVMGITSFEGGEIDIFDSKKGMKTIKIEPRSILLESSMLDGSGRGRFAAAHETAHIAIHASVDFDKDKKTDKNAIMRKRIICTREQDWQTEIKGKADDMKWIEWQANYLAAALLMPEGPFRVVIDEFIKNTGMSATLFMENPNEYNRIMETIIVPKVAQVFDTSKTATFRRMKALRYIDQGVRFASE